MADTVVENSASTALELTQGLWGPYWINPLIGALVLCDGGARPIVAYRTTDGGASWSQITVGANNNPGLVVFFDREVPGDTGTLLHIWWQDLAEDAVLYRTLDLSDGSLGTTRIVTSGFVSGLTTLPQAACKTRNGNLLIAGYDDGLGGLGGYCFRSTDGGVTWSARTNPFESLNDSGKLFPANTGDGADACLIYYDDSATELSIKMYDDSANTWTETGIATSIDVGSVAVAQAHNGFDAALRHSDGAILLASWTLIDNAAADLLTWTITPTSIVSPGVSAGANVLTDTAESGCAAIAINQQNDDVYVAYALGVTWAALVDVKYKVSTDGMATWGTQQDYSETTDDIRRISGPRSISRSGGRIQWAWYNDDLNIVLVNLVNDVEIAKAAAAVFDVSALLAGIGTITGNLAVEGIHSVSALLQGQGVLTGDAEAELFAAATLAGQGGIQASLGGVHRVMAMLTGQGQLTATADRVLPVASLLTGQGDVTASLALIHKLAALLTGQGHITGELSTVLFAAALLAGQGNVVATLILVDPNYVFKTVHYSAIIKRDAHW